MHSEKPLEQEFMDLLRTLHHRWRLASACPFLYLAGALILHRHAGVKGWFAGESSARFVLLLASVSLAIFLFVRLAILRGEYYERLRQHAMRPRPFSEAARTLQLRQYMLADFVALPGVILFLLFSDAFALIGFCLASLIAYLLLIPSGRRLGESFFHPETAPQ